jgi:hypothetical protein
MIKIFRQNNSSSVNRPRKAPPARFVKAGFKKFIMKKRKKQFLGKNKRPFAE